MICDSSESLEFCAIVEELNYLEFCNLGNRAWESWNKYSSFNFLFTRVRTHFLLKTLTYNKKCSLTLTGSYKKSKVVVSWHCGRAQSQDDVHLHQQRTNKGFRRLNYHCAASFFRTEASNRAYGSHLNNKNPKVKKVMCIRSECELFFFVLTQHDSSMLSIFFQVPHRLLTFQVS